MSKRVLVLGVSGVLLAGCAATPHYERPATELPANWNQTAERPASAARWWRIYADPVLDQLVEEAHAHNTDMLLAAARVDEARAVLAQADSAFYPSVGMAASGGRSLSSSATGLLPPGVERERNLYRGALDVAYEVDLWGRLRTASQAAQAELLASAAARDTMRISITAEVVKAYFGLRALDAQVDATRRSLALRIDWLALQRKRLDSGLVSEAEYRQLEAEVAAARAQLAPLERDRELQDAALAVLLGRSPRAIIEDAVARPMDTVAALLPAVLPAGLPSELLLRRPDLVEAEQRLVAANARVALARSAYFPSVQLTGLLGTEAAALSNLFTGPAAIWQLAAAVTAPIFSGGRLAAQTEAAEARERQAVAAYQGSIQNAFREVRAALAAQTRARESFQAESERADALAATLRLTRMRYEHGLASQLEIIDAERNLLAADIARAGTLRAQRAAVADLFRALGG
ncbi:MAG: membrane protein [Betaproteobacteria bacterium]